MNQQERIRDYLDSGRKLTRLNAWDELGILEAPARISELRQSGYDIVTDRRSVENRYGEKVSIAVWSKENPGDCLHEGWSFEKHGRCCCKCGKFLMDFGD